MISDYDLFFRVRATKTTQSSRCVILFAPAFLKINKNE